ncbi:unnamed protein product [Polarella glacialis]|uniref:Uncharacterized protein n=1 Tax=Polarella glacialis TaxID=89957 RepID=A0A813EI03_POLGL|nr:unnamed protein product [Polarella glacialis]
MAPKRSKMPRLLPWPTTTLANINPIPPQVLPTCAPSSQSAAVSTYTESVGAGVTGIQSATNLAVCPPSLSQPGWGASEKYGITSPDYPHIEQRTVRSEPASSQPPSSSSSSAAGVSSVATVGGRRFQEVVYRRGSASTLSDLLISPVAQVGAFNHLMDNLVATTSRAPRASCLKMWLRLHHGLFGVESEPFPITQRSLIAVSSILFAANYRSGANYIARAKDRHRELGHQWTSDIQWAELKVNRAFARGSGTDRQSAPLDPTMVSTAIGSLPELPHGLHDPARCILIGSFFLLRELELAAARVGDLTLDMLKRTVTLRLPISKTDQGGAGTSRIWPCCCLGTITVPCAFCCMCCHVESLALKFGVRSTLTSFPLFPSCDGLPVTKAAVVLAIEAMAVHLGLPLLDTLGRRAFGGHSLRVSGAQYLASRGLSLAIICAMGRWGSSAVLRYIGQTASAASLAPHISALLRGESGCGGGSEAIPWNRPRFLRAPCEQAAALDGFELSLSDVSVAIDKLNRNLNMVSATADFIHTHEQNPSLVLNSVSDVVHFIKGNSTNSGTPLSWTTRCGVPFQHKFNFGFIGETERHKHKTCSSCFTSRVSEFADTTAAPPQTIAALPVEEAVCLGSSSSESIDSEPEGPTGAPHPHCR